VGQSRIERRQTCIDASTVRLDRDGDAEQIEETVARSLMLGVPRTLPYTRSTSFRQTLPAKRAHGKRSEMNTVSEMNGEETAPDAPASAVLEELGSGFGRRPAILRGIIAAAVLIGIAIAIIALRGHNGQASTAQGAVGPLDSRSPVLKQPAPNFALRDTSGKVVRLSDLRGQVVLINFWATWCAPCRQEMPAIEQAYRDQKSQSFTVLEVDDQEPTSDVLAFAHQLGETPPILLDENGAVTAQYALKGLPDSFFVDRQGIVRGVSYGPMTQESILKNIESARQAAP
jgi:cytochrome c biogenesis protein CcmG/thiol:disulfide interchange protein DsbE